MYLADIDLDNILPLAIIFGTGLIVAVVAIVMGVMKDMIVSKQREDTRREIAAYIAEGTMTPEEGERLLQSGRRKSGGKKS